MNGTDRPVRSLVDHRWEVSWPGESSALAVGVMTATALAVLDIALGVKLTQLLVVAPCLAAVSAAPRAVVWVGAYALALMTVLTVVNGNAGTSQQAVTAVGAIAVTAVSVAVARSRQRLQAAVASTAQLAAVVENSDDAMITTSLSGTVTSWNHGAVQLFGYAPGEIFEIGALAFLVLAGVDGAAAAGVAGSRRAAHLVLAQIALGERVEYANRRHRHRDGSDRDLSISVFPIRDHAGTVIGCSAICRDRTAAVRAAVEQEALRSQLHQAQRLESLGLLASGVAHDFNNLLTVITVAAELVETEVGDPLVLKDVSMISTAAANASALTRQLLVFARGDSLELQVLDVAEVVEELGDLLRATVGAGVAVDIAPAAQDRTPVYANRGRIEQILLNLAVNARDAMAGDGGVLTIATRRRELTEASVGLIPPPPAGRYLDLSVSDTGSGMSAETAARIFEPFFTTKKRGAGTGLGLATVYGAVTDAGGSIGVQSVLGYGTTFHIYLPAAGPPTALGGSTDSRASATLTAH